MTTDNRTNGRIVAKALVAHCEEHKMPFPRGSVKKIVEALRVAGRLAGEPTEAQVEAAAKELLRSHMRRVQGREYPVFSGWNSLKPAIQDQWRDDARAALEAAALVAAQGAAPQAESEPKPHTRVVTRSFDSDCALGICMSGCSHLMWVCDSCSSEGGWGAARGQLKKWAAEHVCPVLPSSGVDEEALAEVIDMHREVYLPKQGDSGCSCGWRRALGDNDFVAHRARAVAEWLKGQGR